MGTRARGKFWNRKYNSYFTMDGGSGSQSDLKPPLKMIGKFISLIIPGLKPGAGMYDPVGVRP